MEYFLTDFSSKMMVLDTFKILIYEHIFFAPSLKQFIR
jgi:hypothetical protein